MYKKWKSVAALGMAVLIGCMMPVDTMIVAAEENPEVSQENEVDSDSDDEVILDGENAGDDEKDDEDENTSDEENADNEEKTDNIENDSDEIDADDENTGDEVNEDNENADDEVNADEDEYADFEVDIDNYGIALMSETGGAEAGDIVAPASIDAPKIEIKWNGEPYTYDLGDTIDFKYVNINKVDQAFECSASQGASISYCLEQVNSDAVARDKNGMNITWLPKLPSFWGDFHYVLYVKAVGTDGQITYARSGGIVVDTESPEVTGVENGKSYSEGTPFTVKDKNLESVTVNNEPVTLAPDGKSYQGSVSGTTCVIEAEDKAGNVTICSINVSGNLADNVIRKSGNYSLEANVKYQLGEGKWQVGGDKSVYSGGSTFYVKTSGDYTFTKR